MLYLLNKIKSYIFFAQFEHTTYNFVLDILLICVRDLYFVLEKIIIFKNFKYD